MTLDVPHPSMLLLTVLRKISPVGILTLRNMSNSITPTTWWALGKLAHDFDFGFKLTLQPSHQGFFCVGCPKLFPLKNPPRPQPSPNAGTRRSVNTSPLTRERVFKKRKEILKKSGELARKLGKSGDGIRIRGRWISTRKPILFVYLS